jgi:hypothetical protein
MVPLLSRLWMMDVHRDPLRFRYRLCGTTLVRSLNARSPANGWTRSNLKQSTTVPVVAGVDYFTGPHVGNG